VACDCIAVLVYKCPAMASSCGRCRSIESSFDCGWCLATSTCTVQSQCISSANGSAGWLHRRQACHDPAITYVCYNLFCPLILKQCFQIVFLTLCSAWFMYMYYDNRTQGTQKKNVEKQKRKKKKHTGSK